MRKWLLMFCCLAAYAALAAPLPQNNILTLHDSLQTIREKLLVLLITQDKNKQTELIKKISVLSEEIEIQARDMLNSPETRPEDKRKLTEFLPIWKDFKKTRDEEIIPRLLTGNAERLEEAKNLARTIQAERFQKMKLLLQ